MVLNYRIDHEPSFIAEASFVKAPLNSRVGTSNVTPNGKGKSKQESLDRVPLEVQEALILEDLLYVLMVCNTFVNALHALLSL